MSRYSSKFWRDIYANAAEKCVISTHTGPLCQFSAGMSTNLALVKDLMAAGFKQPLVGKVAISSFMGEWGYLLCTKETAMLPPAVGRRAEEEGACEEGVRVCPAEWASHLPDGLQVLDEKALQSFLLIPKYYYRGC